MNTVEGVSVALFQGDDILLVRRAFAPYQGYWSLPGGRIRCGECALAAARRELLEETGLTAGELHFVTFFSPRAQDPQLDVPRYRLHVFAGTQFSGALAAGDDAEEARWQPVDNLHDLLLTPQAPQIIDLALRQLALRENGQQE